MRKFTLWLVWICLTTIYVATVLDQYQEGNTSVLVSLAINLACAIFLWFAEGFEIAFAMVWPLRDKTDGDIRSSLQGLDPEFVLAQRQVVVVATITVVSLTSKFDWILVPGVGRVSSFGAPAWFSGLFTTLSILWFCQVFPKRIAAKSTERFWRLSKWLLRPVLAAGKLLDLPGPVDHLVKLWDAVFGGEHCSPKKQSATIQVAPLWGPCDCAVCQPRMDFAGFNSSAELRTCSCAVCDRGDGRAP